MQSTNRKHAVVIGASMGGLLASRALSDHFESVTIIDRDQMPAVGEQRRYAPQGNHTHGLLASGARVLESHFPGLTAQLLAAGAVPGDIVLKSRWFMEGGYLPQVRSGLDGLLLSRPLLEGMVRQRTLKLPNVTLRSGCEAAGLFTAAGSSVVTGVKLRDGGQIKADLIVEASGRNSHSADWLEEIGFRKPEVEQVEVALNYTTRLFRREPNHLNGDLAAIIPPTPTGKLGAVMLAQEGNRWTVTLAVHFGKAAPTDLAGFREFARNLHAPDIDSVIRTAEPIGEAQTYRFPSSLRKRYERLASFPEGYLAFGDAISSFNPIYGQGMSSSALQSVALGECLAEGDTRLAQRFFAKAAKVVDIPWSIAVGNDLRMPETVGPRNAGVNFVNWYISKLHKAAHHDAELTLAFMNVANLLAPPPSVMHPRLAWRVLMGNVGKRSGAMERREAASG